MAKKKDACQKAALQKRAGPKMRPFSVSKKRPKRVKVHSVPSLFSAVFSTPKTDAKKYLFLEKNESPSAGPSLALRQVL